MNLAGSKALLSPKPETLNMFDLEQSIAEWRRQMLASGIKTPMPLDELESHLREDIRALVSAGNPADQAFQLAISRLGSPGPLRTEFNKLKNPAWWPVRIGTWLFVLGMMGMALKIANRLSAGSLGFLLALHIWSVTAGYVAAFMSGGFGVLYICSRLLQALPSERQRALNNAVLLFSKTSVLTVTIALGLGILWCKQNRGVFLTGDLKEIGAICVIIWFVILALTRQYRLISERATMLMSIAGNMIVSLAWFGAGMLGHKFLGFWPLALAIFLGVHILFLVMGLAPPAKAES
jgi:hypothetical protein